MRTIFFLLGVISAESVDCGNWYSNSCRRDEDLRYDPNASDSIVEQAPVWGYFQGFWKYEVNGYGPGGEPLGPSLANPAQPFLVGGFPYSYFPAFGFLNVTIIGSRMYQHRYHIHSPASQEFCDQTLVSGFVNVLGTGTCGETGYSYSSEFFGTSSYERDGTIESVPFEHANPGELLRNGVYILQPVDNRTIYMVGKDSNGGLATETLVFLDSINSQISGVSDFYVSSANQAQLVAFFRSKYERLEGANAFALAIEKAYKSSTVTASDRVEGGKIPMQGACLLEPCPVETEWCTSDPSCSTSPYQEPEGALQAGAIAGIVIASSVLIIGALYMIHRYFLKQQRKRYRAEFAKQVADTIEMTESYYALDAFKLLEEFQRIDDALPADCAGKISKEAMKEFMQSGKVGYIKESDFGALWVAIDTDHSGYVDFLEFCAFLAQCEDLLEDKDRSRDSLAKLIAEKLAKLSMHDVSARSRSLTTGVMLVDDGTNGTPNDDYDDFSAQSSLRSSSPKAVKSLGVGNFA